MASDSDDVSPTASWISDNIVWLLALLVVVWLLKYRINDLRERWFAAFMEWYGREKNAKVEEMKKDLFASLSSVVSHDPELRKRNALKILEIGVGTGTNFEHYPDGSKLVVVDPNPHFISYYNENRKKFANIECDDIIVATGEEMDMVPDNSVDVVVITLVLCSVTSTEKIMKQILRVLVPGGKFYFLEHISEFDTEKHNTRRRIQGFLSKSGIWPFLLGGCNLNRDMLPAIQAAGFSKVEAVKFYAPIDHFVFQLVKPSLRGVCEK